MSYFSADFAPDFIEVEHLGWYQLNRSYSSSFINLKFFII